MTISGYHHLSLTVRDLEASVSWYADLLGLSKMMEETHDGGRAIVLVQPEVGLFLGLHAHDSGDRQPFDETRIGLDHVAIGVADRDDLEAWERVLTDKGVVHSAIADRPWGSVLAFRDPDNIQLEFYSPPVS
jgi:glyoxylase I family protein